MFGIRRLYRASVNVVSCRDDVRLYGSDVVTMSPVGAVYDGASLVLSGSSLFFLFQSTSYLSEKDYVAALLTVIVGFFLLRVGVEFGKLALVARRRRRERGDQ